MPKKILKHVEKDTGKNKTFRKKPNMLRKVMKNAGNKSPNTLPKTIAEKPAKKITEAAYCVKRYQTMKTIAQSSAISSSTNSADASAFGSGGQALVSWLTRLLNNACSFNRSLTATWDRPWLYNAKTLSLAGFGAISCERCLTVKTIQRWL